ncbi:MAG: hypothetical protein LBL13_01335 [Bacteroidales bacterium]|nr:hypothetical protein [Bacteroidales bacterium]
MPCHRNLIAASGKIVILDNYPAAEWGFTLSTPRFIRKVPLRQCQRP